MRQIERMLEEVRVAMLPVGLLCCPTHRNYAPHKQEDAADLEEAREKLVKTAPRSCVRRPPRCPTLKPRLDEKARFCKEQQMVGMSSSLAAQMQQMNTG
jgi:hypothetical protein